MPIRVGVNNAAKDVAGVYVLTDADPYFYQIEKVMIGDANGAARQVLTGTPKSLTGYVKVTANAYGNGWYHPANIDGIPVFSVKEYESENDVNFSMICPGVFYEDSSGPFKSLPGVNGRVILFIATNRRISVYLDSYSSDVFQLINNPITIWGSIDTMINFFCTTRRIRMRSRDSRTSSYVRCNYTLKKNGNDVKASLKSGSAYYVLSDSEDTVLVSASTSGSYIYKVDAATYVISAIVPDGYHTPDPISVSVSGEESIIFSIVPTAIEFERYDLSAGEGVDGGTYQILDSDGNVVHFTQSPQGTYTVSESGASTFTTVNGIAYIYGLKELSQYYFVETITPSGYQSEDSLTITVLASATPNNEQVVCMSADPI